MSKFRPPTREEVRAYALNAEITRYLEAYRERRGVAHGDVRTLDWGCGRGEAVACLLDRGYDAMGADISDEALGYGTEYFRAIGDAKAEQRLWRIGDDGRLQVPDNSFDYVFSQTVLEHVADLDAVARELFRILKPGGVSLHCFPAHRHVVENHLGMPFVHWLPKNRLQRWAVAFWVRMGREPHWVEEPVAARVDRYAHYARTGIYYRTPGQLRASFAAAGFAVAFVSVDHPRLQRHPVLGPILRVPPLRRLLGWAVHTFTVMELTATKPQSAAHSLAGDDSDTLVQPHAR